MRRAFGQAGFGRLYGGLAASMLGDSMMLLVLSIWVKTLTGSNALAGLTFLFMVIPSLAAPLLGVLIDRVRRKPMLVAGNLASALVVLPLVLVRDAGDVWIIWLVAFGYGLSFVVLPAALNGLLKEMVPDDLLVEANSALQTTKEAYRLFGPLLGAALFAWLGGWSVAVIDAASFVVAAWRSGRSGSRRRCRSAPRSRSCARSAPAMRHLVTDRVLGHTLIGVGLSLLVIGFVEASIYALLDAFDRPPTYAGVFVAAMGVGAIALRTGRLPGGAPRRRGERDRRRSPPVRGRGGRHRRGALDDGRPGVRRGERCRASADDHRLPHPPAAAHAAGDHGPGVDGGRGGAGHAAGDLAWRSARCSSWCGTTG